MAAATQATASQPPQKRWVTWTGRVVSVVPVFFIMMGAVSAMLQPKAVADGMARFGYAADRLPIILTLELTAVLLYVIPQTAVFGAVLMTAYLGGAVATHVRIADPGWPLAVVGGVCAWVGLYLREERLRMLVPLRRPPAARH